MSDSDTHKDLCDSDFSRDGGRERGRGRRRRRRWEKGQQQLLLCFLSPQMTKRPPVSIAVTTSGVSAQYFCPPHEAISIRLESSHLFYFIYSFIDLRARRRGRPWPRRRCPPWSTTSSPPSSTPSRLPRVRKTDRTKRKKTTQSSFLVFSN